MDIEIKGMVSLKFSSWIMQFNIVDVIKTIKDVSPEPTGCFKSSFRFFLSSNFTDY